ncbi:uncharacterized protein PAC_19827 [Phialocephala subalpina]|uniref:Uncharacterized protein n=1 Tax=Phialocephala subalpina TaxID=576137 RepID=A0A1L7XY81_9HELO|nr:uncharacterized protein PAC_19827 [Phialocephala subalpina]
MTIVRKRGWLSVGILFDHPTEALLKSIRKSHPIFSTNRDAVWPSIKIINSTPAGTEDQIKRVLASIIRPSRPFPLYFLRKRFENHKEKLEDQELRPRTPQNRRNRQVRLYFESPQLEQVHLQLACKLAPIVKPYYRENSRFDLWLRHNGITGKGPSFRMGFLYDSMDMADRLHQELLHKFSDDKPPIQARGLRLTWYEQGEPDKILEEYSFDGNNEGVQAQA